MREYMLVHGKCIYIATNLAEVYMKKYVIYKCHVFMEFCIVVKYVLVRSCGYVVVGFYVFVVGIKNKNMCRRVNDAIFCKKYFWLCSVGGLKCVDRGMVVNAWRLLKMQKHTK